MHLLLLATGAVRVLYWAVVFAILTFVIGVIAFLPRPAQAQVIAPATACLPSQLPGGTGSAALVRIADSPVVMCARWFCPPASGVGHWSDANAVFLPTYYLQARRNEFLSAAMRGDAAWMAIQRNYPRTDANYVRCVDEPSFVAAASAARPAPAYRYRVAPNVQSTTTPPTRPAYQILNGARVPWDGYRAVVGEGCLPEVRRDGDYMAFGPAFAMDIVALCK